MKLLGLLRHAKSEWDDMSLRDFDRGLNKRGRKGAALIGRHIRDHGVKWDRLLASPAERVKGTLEAAELGLEPNFQQDAYLSDAPALIQLVREHGGDSKTMLLAAHNPGLQELALRLAGEAEDNGLYEEILSKYPTSSFTVIELEIDDWKDAVFGCGKIVHFARPRDLDPDLGPEEP